MKVREELAVRVYLAYVVHLRGNILQSRRELARITADNGVNAIITDGSSRVHEPGERRVGMIAKAFD